jgi:hypothetical protein
MCVLQHAALHVNGQHTVWQSMDIDEVRILGGLGEVKLGFVMLRIEKVDSRVANRLIGC